MPQEETTSPQLGPRLRGDERVTVAAAAPEPASAASVPAAVAARLQGTVGRVLPAIEAAIAKLGAGAQRPREMEQTARALGTLIRTLRELNGLLAQHSPPSPPEDSDALRLRLAQKLTNMLAQEREDVPRRYLAAWLDQPDGTAGES